MPELLNWDSREEESKPGIMSLQIILKYFAIWEPGNGLAQYFSNSFITSSQGGSPYPANVFLFTSQSTRSIKKQKSIWISRLLRKGGLHDFAVVFCRKRKKVRIRLSWDEGVMKCNRKEEAKKSQECCWGGESARLRADTIHSIATSTCR